MDGIPVDIFDELRIDTKEDFAKLIPQDLTEPFTVKDFAKKAKITEHVASCGLNILFAVDAVRRTGKKGNAYLYEKNTLRKV